MNRQFILISKSLALVGILLLFCFLINQEIRRAQIRTINCFMPNSYTVLLNPAITLDWNTSNHYITYYKILSAVIHTNADVYAMIGFCYSRIGHDKLAIKFLEKAVALKPQSFWIYYDLGVLYLKKDDFTKASQVLTQAIRIRPQDAFKAIYSSKIYTDIILNQEIPPQALAGRLTEGYQIAFKLLQTSLLINNKQTSSESIREFIKSINVQIL